MYREKNTITASRFAWYRSFSVQWSILKSISLSFLIPLVMSFGAAHAQSDFFGDVGYTALRAELGESLPVAAGVPVMLVEADQKGPTGVLAYAPDATNSEFRGKKITVGEGGPRVYAPFSSHATGVGRRFFGLRTSMSPGIDRIASYRTSNWFGAAFLRLNEIRQPKVTASRVASHAWVGSVSQPEVSPADARALRRVDWLVETDEFFHVVGFNAGHATPLLGDAFNVLSVSHTAATRFRNTLALDANYGAGRARPDLVAPEKTPSASTGRVASVAALLIGIGHANPSLSHGVTANRHGDAIYNAERSEVIKAILLAGADRATRNYSGENVTGYRAAGENRMANGFDRRYGAGQLNVHHSYRLLVAGEQDSVEDQAASGQIATVGFDYDESFGGADGSNRQATYRLSVGSAGGTLTVSLVWNIDIAGGRPLAYNATATLRNLDLILYDMSGADPVVVAESASVRDNSENLHVKLDPNHDYMIRVRPGSGEPPFRWDYGLAWRLGEEDGL